MLIHNLGFDDSLEMTEVDAWLGKGALKVESYTSISDINTAIDCDAIVINLENCPLELPEDYVLGAIIDRKATALSLHIDEAFIEMSNDLRLAQLCSIKVPDLAIAHQVSALRPDVVLYLDADAYENGEDVNAAISYKSESPTNWKTFVVHPRDIVPKTSVGLIGILVRPALTDLRKNIRGLHKLGLGQCSNIERGFSKMCREAGMTDISCHCISDQNGHFHAFASAFFHDKLVKANMSQSTAHYLAEVLFKKFTT
jgi:porphobilinogen deaminase